MIKFLLVFYSCFVIASLALFLCFDRTNEILASLIWFEGIYILTGVPAWILINKMIRPTSVRKMIIRFFVGLVLLNILSLIINGTLPTIGLITIGRYQWGFGMSLCLHAVFSLSYLLASIVEKRTKRRASNMKARS
jgi:hypothetical protein